MRRLLLLDNHDSFTWNLAHALETLGAAVDVRRNDEVDLAWVRERGFDAWVISPGPGRPEDAGLTPALVAAAVESGPPLLGVCLGHQALAEAFGARIVGSPVPVHGKTSTILHDGTGLYHSLPPGFPATRYHSLEVDPASVPAALEVDARTPDGTIMGLHHRTLPLYGVQFHPESVLTVAGPALLRNFLELAAARACPPSRMVVHPEIF